MSDFAQTGLICTLQRLNDEHLPKIERELTLLAHERPIALVLPCHGADLERPALAHIVAELGEGPHFLREIVVSMNGLDAAGFAREPGARRFRAAVHDERREILAEAQQRRRERVVPEPRTEPVE